MDYQPYPHLIQALDRHYGYQMADRASGKLRVLLTTFWPYPQPGGLSRYIGSLKRGLEGFGHHVDIQDYHAPRNATQKFRGSIERDLIRRYFIRRYGEANAKGISVCQKLRAYELQLRERLSSTRYDVFHAQDRFTANVLGQVSLDYPAPIFYTPHQLGINRSLRLGEIKEGTVEAAFYRAIDRGAIRSASRIITLCDVFHGPLTGLGASPEKLETVYTGIDFPVPQKTRNPSGRVLITSVSRITRRKGHKYLLLALAMIKDYLDNVDVLIVGDGEARKDIERLARHLDLRNVIFGGYREDVADILSGSDIFVHPTTSDMLPICIIEAMFASQAIVTTNVNGIPEIISDGETGFIVEPGSVQPLAEKLLLLVQDATLRKSLGTNARMFAEAHLRADRMARKIVSIYYSALET
ncbi:glycosyltransferase family 4 protein [Sulfobacillus harzensis]|uniref:Glycosyltransferase family 4 protein n=1 Tax=Sulfobacillus harzensis TaxID=2729629 RepID=A0A7Y0L282_9FIRM|nr:glycosyltransferase family 4 protein [Sulfobacillus harzensis]NMP21953.1 glycosyltransferase family 4 protein [Sulfobacillus harzensis]